MLKLLLCLLCALVLGMTLLQMRQQKLELSFQCNRLHNAIRARQNQLWNQQLQIAVFTSPNSIAKTVGDHQLHMVPEAPNAVQAASWSQSNSDAE